MSWNFPTPKNTIPVGMVCRGLVRWAVSLSLFSAAATFSSSCKKSMLSDSHRLLSRSYSPHLFLCGFQSSLLAHCGTEQQLAKPCSTPPRFSSPLDNIEDTSRPSLLSTRLCFLYTHFFHHKK